MLIWLPALTLRAKVNLGSRIRQMPKNICPGKSRCNATMANGFTIDSGFTLTWNVELPKTTCTPNCGINGDLHEQTGHDLGTWFPYTICASWTVATAGYLLTSFSRQPSKNLGNDEGNGGLYTRHSEDETIQLPVALHSSLAVQKHLQSKNASMHRVYMCVDHPTSCWDLRLEGLEAFYHPLHQDCLPALVAIKKINRFQKGRLFGTLTWRSWKPSEWRRSHCLHQPARKSSAFKSDWSKNQTRF